MRKLLFGALTVLLLIRPVYAVEFTAPLVPDSGAELMPRSQDFAEGLWELLDAAVDKLYPYLREAAVTCMAVMAAALSASLWKDMGNSGTKTSRIVFCLAVAVLLLRGTDSMIRLGRETIRQICEYGRLLLPVLTAALAAQGGVTASAALYTGTALFTTLLSSLMEQVFVPVIYLFLALSVAEAALGEQGLRQLRELSKSFVSWCLKTVLTVFTTYMSITGVVSGTTDAAMLKTTKVTISSLVPVVGGILSDASEAVLVSAGVMKNAAGVYGLLAVLAVFILPFLRLSAHYLLLKLTAALCSVFAPKPLTDLIGDFSGALGLLLAMTGAVSLLQLISTVCFMKGVG